MLQAFETAGSLLGTAKLLNLAGVPSKRGQWTSNGVRGVLGRAGVWVSVHQGVKHRQSFKFAQLLRCPHDGQFLTGQHQRWSHYFCSHGYRDPRHPRPYGVSERNVEPWIRTEVARLRTPELVQIVEADRQRRMDLAGRRDRLVESYIEGLLDRAARDARLQTIDAELAKLDATGRSVAVPTIDWEWPPDQTNLVLRALLSHIELDEHMRPVRAEWRVPEWRA